MTKISYHHGNLKNTILDEVLELKIIQALKNFKPLMTIVLVSHDKKLIDLCTKIFELKSKKIKQNI